MKKIVRVERGERIDAPDFIDLAETARSFTDEQFDALILGQGQQNDRSYVLWGFDLSIVGTTITINRGAAIAPYKDRGETHYGAVLADGDSTKAFNIASFPDGGYGIYIRLAFQDSSFTNRTFWDALSLTPVEFTRNIATRRAENWDVAIELTSPGNDWLQISTVNKVGPSVTIASNGGPDFFWEGKKGSPADYSVRTSEWGSPNDRNDDRATYGLRSLRKFVRAVQAQIVNVRGQRLITDGWWKTPGDLGVGSVADGALGVQSLVELTDNKLARDGSQTITGSLFPDISTAHNLGSPTQKFGVANFLDLVTDFVGSHLIPLPTATFDLGSLTNYWRNLFSGFVTIKGNSNGDLNFEGLGGAPILISLASDGSFTDDKKAEIIWNQFSGGLDINAGISASEGIRNINLRGKNNKIAKYCHGEGGFYFEFGVILPVTPIIPNNWIEVTAGLVPPFGHPPIVVGDQIIALYQNTDSAAPLLVNDAISIVQYYISATNTVKVMLHNDYSLADGGSTQPSSNTNYPINIAIIRRVSG